MKKGQSNRLTAQQKEGQGPITIFHKDAQIHDKEVGNTSLFVMKQLEFEFPMLKFRYRKDLSKKEINEALQRVDEYLGQTLLWKVQVSDQMEDLLKFKTIMVTGGSC